MKEKSLKKNFAYNFLYQLLAIIVPLITSPYKQSYSHSLYTYENNRQFRQDCKYFVDLLNRAKRNKHPKYEFYCNEFISQGLPKDLLK